MVKHLLKCHHWPVAQYWPLSVANLARAGPGQWSECRPWSPDSGSQRQPDTRRIFSACVVRTLTAWSDDAVTQPAPRLTTSEACNNCIGWMQGYLDIDILFIIETHEWRERGRGWVVCLRSWPQTSQAPDPKVSEKKLGGLLLSYLGTRIFKNQISPMFWGFSNTSQYQYVCKKSFILFW